MKKLLFIFSAVLATSNLFAADVTVTERFSKVIAFNMVSQRDTLKGDLTDWAIRYGRRKDTDTLFANERATWLQGQNDYGYLEMNENFEGGIKNIAFNWGHGNENGYTIVLRMFVRGTNSWGEPVQTWGNTPSDTKAWQDHVSYDLQLKKNSRIKFDNKSVKTSDGSQPIDAKGRPLIGDITITPYLYYTKKQDTISLGNVTYVNTALINNIDAGSVTYSATGKASINATTGAVTPLDTGVAIITATWGEVSTSYRLYIEQNPEVEMFNGAPTGGKYSQNKQEYTGNMATWTSYWGGVKESNSNFPSQTATLKARHNDKEYGNESMISSSSIVGGISELSFQWNLIGDEDNTTWDIRVYVNDVEVGRMTDLGSGIKPQVQIFSVKNLDYTGNVVIKIKNLSTISTSYSSNNMGRIAIDNLQIKPFSGIGTCVLNETDKNPQKIALYTTPNTDFQLTRTFSSEGYNTLCLPFAVAQNELETYFGAEAKLYEMTEADTSDGITINFVEVSSGGIVAGKPYLLEVASDVVNPTFTARTITAATPNSVTTDQVTYQGVYVQTMLDPDAIPVQYFLSKDLLYRPVKADYMKGLRGYFKISNITPGAPIRMQVNKPSTPTNLEVPSLLGEGRGEALKIILNGHLHILRDACVYDAQGGRIK